MQADPIPYGYCQCGCGEKTNLALRNEPRFGAVKGEPRRFRQGHARRGKVTPPETRAKLSLANRGARAGAWKGDDASYRALHGYLCAHNPKAHVCEECGRGAERTEYALIHGRTYSRNRDDYREMCRPCHMRYDFSSDTCKQGHAWTPESTMRHSKTGKRSCRICRNERRRANGWT